jgi:TPP-dependent pyruvate/acetoin dehydrogenase alpha subunit
MVRAGSGPVFLELRTYRFRAHSMFDPELYREKQEVEAWKRRDPIELAAGRLRARGALDDARLAAIEREVAQEIESAVAFAEGGTLEPVEDLTRFVCSEREVP